MAELGRNTLVKVRSLPVLFSGGDFERMCLARRSSRLTCHPVLSSALKPVLIGLSPVTRQKISVSDFGEELCRVITMLFSHLARPVS